MFRVERVLRDSHDPTVSVPVLSIRALPSRDARMLLERAWQQPHLYPPGLNSTTHDNSTGNSGDNNNRDRNSNNKHGSGLFPSELTGTQARQLSSYRTPRDTCTC